MISDRSPFALVVDDNPLIRLHAADIVQEAGFRPLEAADVAEALDLLAAHGTDIALLFTDVDLGAGQDGFQLALEAANRLPELKILIASGNREPADGLLPAGAVFIRKPFSAEIVHARLQELLPEGQQPEPLRSKA